MAVTQPNRDRIEAAEQELEQWLERHAKMGLPELVLVGLLHEYADRVERMKYIPRTREVTTESETADRRSTRSKR